MLKADNEATPLQPVYMCTSSLSVCAAVGRAWWIPASVHQPMINVPARQSRRTFVPVNAQVSVASLATWRHCVCGARWRQILPHGAKRLMHSSARSVSSFAL